MSKRISRYLALNLAALLYMLALIAVAAAVHGLLWGMDIGNVAAAFAEMRWSAFGLLCLAYISRGLAHGIAFLLFTPAHRNDLKIGFAWQCVTAYAISRTSVTARQYRIVCIFPGSLWLLLTAVGVATNQAAITLSAVFLLGTAAGDLVMLWYIRRFQDDDPVMDADLRRRCGAA